MELRELVCCGFTCGLAVKIGVYDFGRKGGCAENSKWEAQSLAVLHNVDRGLKGADAVVVP